ncbi:hypothetical protein [Ralstonia sp. RRA.1]|uniref:hypothetical protein n=2 Tax=Pseudomonadota TaxID=1224 RepID=UPI0030CDA170
MDRVIVYPGQIPLETDVLRTNKFGMLAVAKLAAAMLGTSTIVNGLACVPTSPASLQVNVNPGEMYSLVNVDATAYSSLAADTTHSILKQGISLDAVTLSCPAPATGGQSINYLIQATYQDSDTDNTTLPYYNASNPSQAWSGPNNSGTPQSTTRKGAVVISAKAGTAATTGTQTTPAPDSGYTGLWVVTVANGQSTITSANITQATNAPILPADLLHAIQQSLLTVASDTGSANTYVVSYSPPVTALTDGMVLWFKAKTANTGASTLNVNGLGAVPLVGGAHAALQGNEVVANGKCQVVYKADISSFVLIECTGAAVQVAPATQSQHALQLGQAQAMRGSYNGSSSYSTSATLTNSQIGQLIIFYGGPGQTITLPSVLIPQGSQFNIINIGSGSLTVAANGTDTIDAGPSALSSINVPQFCEVTLTPDGSGTRWAQKGSASLQYSPLAVGASTQSGHAVNQSQVVGVGQTFTNVTASRASGTTYTNSTGKPIIVYVNATTTASNGALSIAVNGVTCGFSVQPISGSVVAATALVPSGGTYVVSVGSANTLSWSELR